MKRQRIARTVIVRVATLAILAVSATPAPAAPILSFDPASGVSANNQAQSVGWRFTVETPVTVTGLGWYAPNGGPLALSHRVGLWDPSGALLTSVVVPIGTAAPFDGLFRTADVTPLVLSPGVDYVVGGENFFGNPDRLATNVTQTVDPRITYGHPTFSLIGSGFTRPDMDSGATTGFYGPSFSAAPAPEPSTLTLAGLGTLGLLGYVWRRRKRAA
jgi:LPXTG-motif cell wall-anchored protein